MTVDPAAFAASFAAEWIAAWNARDLPSILSHYTDDVVFLSPRAAQLVGDGRVVGKPALEAYWTRALARAPDLHFELIDVYAGYEALTLNYARADGRKACETFEFAADGRVCRSVATYL